MSWTQRIFVRRGVSLAAEEQRVHVCPRTVSRHTTVSTCVAAITPTIIDIGLRFACPLDCADANRAPRAAGAGVRAAAGSRDDPGSGGCRDDLPSAPCQ